MREWVTGMTGPGDRFNPDTLDVHQVNRRLRKLFPPNTAAK